MDIFGYVPAENVRQRQAQREREQEDDGFAVERGMLRDVRLELARRRARRHPIYQADVRAVVRDLFGDVAVGVRLEFPAPTTPPRRVVRPRMMSPGESVGSNDPSEERRQREEHEEFVLWCKEVFYVDSE